MHRTRQRVDAAHRAKVKAQDADRDAGDTKRRALVSAIADLADAIAGGFTYTTVELLEGALALAKKIQRPKSI